MKAIIEYYVGINKKHKIIIDFPLKIDTMQVQSGHDIYWKSYIHKIDCNEIISINVLEETYP